MRGKNLVHCQLMVLIGQFSHDAICCEDSKQWWAGLSPSWTIIF